MVDPKRIFWNPDEGFCGDFIPAYYGGAFHLFYIHGRPWEHIATRDFVGFEELPRAVESGGDDAPDRDIYTGCVVPTADAVHIFYTGNNDELAKRGLPQQVTLHAVSTDGVHFVKDPDFRIEPDGERFRSECWRDPHVFYNAEDGLWWMIVTASARSPIHRRWGETMLLTSPDLTHWTPREALYPADEHDTHECADLFMMGDWWYLVYSTYSKLWETRYRMARDPRGPWLRPRNDVIAGRALYAAKTVSDGERRFLVGWACRKTDGLDAGQYEWGGCLAVLALGQRPDGTLTTRLPEPVLAEFADPLPVAPRPWLDTDYPLAAFRAEGAALVVRDAPRFGLCQIADTGDDFRLRFTARNLAPSDVFENRFGVCFYANGDYSRHTELVFDCNRGAVTLDSDKRWMFGGRGFDETLSADLSGAFGVELTVYGSVCVLTVNGADSLVFRVCEERAGRLGFFVCDGGSFSITDITLAKTK